jgi:hypothetical protein
MQGFGQGKWWTLDYIYSLGIPVVLSPVIVWFMFVPRRIEYSDTQITISTLLGTQTYAWSDLYCYGTGRGVYKIQFTGDSQPYQIFAGAYSDQEWSQLVALMNTRFPDRVQSGFSIGPGMRPKGDS